MMKSLALIVALCLPLLAWATDAKKTNEAELDSINGLSPASTARVLTAREKAPVKDWADFVRRFKGIKPATAKRLSDARLTVSGQSYVEDTK